MQPMDPLRRPRRVVLDKKGTSPPFYVRTTRDSMSARLGARFIDFSRYFRQNEYTFIK